MSGNRVEARKWLADATNSGTKPEDSAEVRARIGTGYALLSLADAVEHVAEVAEQHAGEQERQKRQQHEDQMAMARGMREAQRIRDEWEAEDRRDAAIRHANRMRARARRWRWVPKALRPAEVRRWSA